MPYVNQKPNYVMVYQPMGQVDPIDFKTVLLIGGGIVLYFWLKKKGKI